MGQHVAWANSRPSKSECHAQLLPDDLMTRRSESLWVSDLSPAFALLTNVIVAHWLMLGVPTICLARHHNVNDIIWRASAWNPKSMQPRENRQDCCGQTASTRTAWLEFLGRTANLCTWDVAITHIWAESPSRPLFQPVRLNSLLFASKNYKQTFLNQTLSKHSPLKLRDPFNPHVSLILLSFGRRISRTINNHQQETLKSNIFFSVSLQTYGTSMRWPSVYSSFLQSAILEGYSNSDNFLA
jgi:hypothetical protein